MARFIATAAFLLLAATSSSSSSSGLISADCIDYESYVHWVAGIDSPGGSVDVVLSGNLAFVAHYTSGLQIVDVSNPESPIILGTIDTPGSAWAVAVSGEFAYVADDTHGLQVIRVGDPANPSIVASVETPGYARGVSVAGSYAYVAGWNSGLQIIDVEDPQNLELLGRISFGTSGYGEGVAVSGDYAYFIEYNDGLQVIRIANARNPEFVGGIDLQDDVSDLVVSGTHAYACGDSGLQVIDVSDPFDPEVVGRVKTPGTAYGLDVSGTHAYSASRWAFQAIDIADPANPQIVGSTDVFYCYGVTVSGSYAYVVAGYPGRLTVVDIADPTNLQVRGVVETPGDWPHGSAISGNYAYVAAPTVGLVVVDVTNPSAPRIVAEIPIDGYTAAVSIYGTYAYVTDSWFGLHIVDIADPLNPAIISTTHAPRPVDLTRSGDTIYLASRGGLLVMDVSDPQGPRMVGSAVTMGNGGHVAVSEQPPGSTPWVYLAHRTYSHPNWNTYLRILPGQCEEASSVDENPHMASPRGSLTVGASPNPFSSTTRLLLDVRKDVAIDLEVLDPAGRSVLERRLGILRAGEHSIPFDGRDGTGHPLPAGVWFVKLRTSTGEEGGIRLVRLP